MVPLQLLWVNDRNTGSRETWRDRFVPACQVHEVDITQLTGPESDGVWDIICFNFDYPEMAQLKLVPQTKCRWPSAPILLLTLQCSTELAVWALRVRVFDLLIKPIASHEIESCLRRVSEAVHARRSQSERRPRALIAPMPVEARYRPHMTPSHRLEQAVAHVNKHFGQSLPESQMAQLCQMSPSRFCREFKTAYGVTYVEYVARYRIVQAKRLLSNPAMSIADAAAAVGFTDPSYFTRVFRRVTGLSPSAYRGCQPACEADPGEMDFASSSVAG